MNSSSTTVYQRRNIERVTNTDPETGNTYEEWQYEERELTKAEYETLTTANQVVDNTSSIAALEDALCDLDASR